MQPHAVYDSFDDRPGGIRVSAIEDHDKASTELQSAKLAPIYKAVNYPLKINHFKYNYIRNRLE